MYGSYEEEKELKAIFEKTFGPVKSKKYNSNSRSFEIWKAAAAFTETVENALNLQNFRGKPVRVPGETAILPSTETTIFW